MIQIKEEKIVELMFDIWHKSNELKNPVIVGEYIAEELTKVKNLDTHDVSQCLPSDEKMHDDLLSIIDKNLSCGTGQESDILCNRFATTSFIREYIKKLLANCG